jgi:DnaJ-class molecular chaperone
MDITLDDLIEPCGNCGGTGKKEQPKSQPGNTSYGQRSLTTSMTGTDDCETCRGSGKYKPTPAVKRFWTLSNTPGDNGF